MRLRAPLHVSRGWLIAAALAGCATNPSGTDSDGTGSASKCVQPIVVGIDQGVAGVAMLESDVPSEPDKPAVNWPITIGSVKTTTDGEGRFAVELAPGDYMTVNADANIMVRVDAGAVTRADLSVSIGFLSWWLPPICAD